MKTLLFRTLVFNSAIGAVIIAIAAGFNVFGIGTSYSLLCLSVLSVLAIIFGENLEGLVPRWRFSHPMEESSGWAKVVETLVSREALVPTFALMGCIWFGYVSPTALERVVVDKAQIVFLILTFAVVAYGIRQSGYFKYAAFRVLEVCDGHMTRMILYLFLLSSILTFATSNDIVILVMTPIILELCRQSQISNARLLLLGQFVAANTLSMGLFIGSPTNIIFSLNVGIDFVGYFFLMVVPTTLALMVSLIMLQFINVFFSKWIRKFAKLGWEYDTHYTMPALFQQPSFTNEMRLWIVFFAIVVFAVAIVSQLGQSLLWVTIPTFFVALIAIWMFRGDNGEEQTNFPSKQPLSAVGDCLSSLPYSIVPFALAFFAIAASLASQIPFEDILSWLFGLPLVANSGMSMLGTATMVNMVNDLPASAIMGEAAKTIEKDSGVIYTMFLQSTLVALNIGCYVTPVGALAGIIWFHVMRREASGLAIALPTRLGMCVYGTLHFLGTASILAVMIPATNVVFRWVIEGHSLAIKSELEQLIVVGAGAVILCMVFLVLASILKRYRVFVGDMRAFLTAASWLQVRSQTGSLLYKILITSLVVTVFGGVIWWAEDTATGGRGFGDFVVWLIVALGSGHFDGWFPATPVGKIVAGLLPLAALVLIVYAVQFIRRTSSFEETSRRIARGEIATRRSVIVDYRAWMREFVESVWKSKDNAIFQTVLYAEQFPPVEWTEQRDYGAIFAKRIEISDDENLCMIVNEYRLHRADEIYLLSERFYGEGSEFRLQLVLDELASNLRNNPTPELGANRLNSMRQGEDPEEFGGRLPRIFVWEDARIGLTENQEIELLLIKLPPEWRHNSERSKRLTPVIGTASEKSWKKRRNQIVTWYEDTIELG